MNITRPTAKRKARSKTLYATLKKNPKKLKIYKARIKHDYLKRIYGITFDDVKEMRKKQKGRCAICSKKTTLHVDHCHKKLLVRGLLCRLCNCGLGFFGDNPAILKKAIHYLRTS